MNCDSLSILIWIKEPRGQLAHKCPSVRHNRAQSDQIAENGGTMRSTLKMTILTAALVGISLAGLQLTNAQEVTFDMGNVSVAFADGYIDRNNQFHHWEHRTDAEQYRAKHTDQ